MKTVSFSRQLEPQAAMVKSPFLRGIKGPGFIGDPKPKVNGEEEDDPDDVQSVPLPRRVGRPSERDKEKDRRISTLNQPYASSPSSVPRPNPTVMSMSVPGPSRTPAQPITPFRTGSTPIPPPAWASSRTFAGVLGGPQVVDQLAQREYLPHETGTLRDLVCGFSCSCLLSARLFERDNRGQVLWFSGPPIPPGTIKIPEQPVHSLEYLEYITKRKLGKMDGTGPTTRKRYATYTVTDMGQDGTTQGDVAVDKVNLKDWWNEGMNQDQILDSLELVVESVPVK
jgi:chromatin structure-remodeling complex subunit RSC1/2